MTIGELRTLLSGFPAEGEVSLVVHFINGSGQSESAWGEVLETNYDVNCKNLVLEGRSD